MRILSLNSTGITPIDTLERLADTPLAENGFLWISCTHDEFGNRQKELQKFLSTQCGGPLVDLHISDLMNPYLPSHYDFTSQYEILVFRRLSSTAKADDRDISAGTGDTTPSRKTRGGPPILKRIHTAPVGFAIFDRILLSLHPRDCNAHATIANRLLAERTGDVMGARTILLDRLRRIGSG